MECGCLGIATRTSRSWDHSSSELVVAITAIIVKQEEVYTYGLLYLLPTASALRPLYSPHQSGSLCPLAPHWLPSPGWSPPSPLSARHLVPHPPCWRGVMTAPDQSHVICGEIPLLAPLFLPTECRCFGIAVRTVRSQDHLSSELVVAILAIVVKEEEVCTYGLLYCNH